MSAEKYTRQERAEKQRNWLKKFFSIDEETFPEEKIRAVREYWSKMSGGQYTVDPIYCQFYSQATGNFDPRYIPDDFQYWTLEYKRINFDYIRAFTDKNYLDIILKGVKMPETLVRCIAGTYLNADYQIISKDEALKKLLSGVNNGFIRKTSIASSGGSGISFAEPSDDEKTIEKFLSLDGSNNFVIQKLISQHPDMAEFNETSVNSIRVLSMLHNGKVSIISTVVRMGANGSKVDNFSSGGICCGVDERGYLKKYCYDARGKQLNEHPSGIKTAGKRVPSYDRICEQVEMLHNRFPQFGIISWDFAVDYTGDPVLIEYNVGRGGIHIHQLCNGPLYGNKTDMIIREIFGVAESEAEDIYPPKITSVQLNGKGLPYIMWEAVDTAESYDVFRAVGENGVMMKMFSTKGTSYTNTSVKPGTKYFYKVCAVGKDGLYTEKGWSRVVEITVD